MIRYKQVYMSKILVKGINTIGAAYVGSWTDCFGVIHFVPTCIFAHFACDDLFHSFFVHLRKRLVCVSCVYNNGSTVVEQKVMVNKLNETY